MRLVLFHNEHERESREFRTVFRPAYPWGEVLDFMIAREAYRFRGCPCVWIGGDTPQDEAWQKAVDVTLPDVQDALGRVRELRIQGPSQTPPGTFSYAINALDFEGKAASLPEGLTLTIADKSVAVDRKDPSVQVTFQDAGVYILVVTGKEAVPGRLEVTVGG